MFGADVKIRAPLTPLHLQKLVVLAPGIKLPLLRPMTLGVLPTTFELIVTVWASLLAVDCKRQNKTKKTICERKGR